MLELPNMLGPAASDEGNFFKLLFGIAVVVIWGLGALVAAINKRAEEAKRRQQYGRISGGTPNPAPPPARYNQPGRYAPQPPPVPGMRQKKPSKKSEKKRQQAVRTAEAEAYAARFAQPAGGSPQQPAYAAPSPIYAAADTAAPAAKASPEPSKIARLARRPETLRAAFILGEVLSPPIALRGNPSHER